MTKLFTPKVATPAAPVRDVVPDSPAAQAASEAERQRKRRAAGQASTILSGGSGGGGANIGTSTLLGG